MEKTQTPEEVIFNEDLHFEHQQWSSELAFWEDELKSFKNRLSELVTRWTDNEVLAQLEHYQNEFILHGGVIEDLQETIEQHETRIAAQTKTGRFGYHTRKKTSGIQKPYGDPTTDLCRFEKRIF